MLVCAGLAVTATPAAAQVGYVKICDAYGVGYYYIPGTDQCAYARQMPLKQASAYGTIVTTPGLNSTGYAEHAFPAGDNSVAIGNYAWSGGDPTTASPGAVAGSNITYDSHMNYPFNTMAPGTAFFNADTTAIGAYAEAGAGGPGEPDATALGEGATADAVSATALGQNADASTPGSVALGAGSVADTPNTVSVGSPGNERQLVNVSPGTVSATSTDAIVGSQLYSTMQSVTTLQALATAVVVNASSPASATGTNATAIGGNSQATQSGGIAVGQGASSTGQNAVAIGTGAQATASNATALGAGAIADQSNTVSVGSPGNEQRITNLAPGTAPTDAVNFGQLQEVGNRADGGTAAALAFAGIPPPAGNQKIALGVGYGSWNRSSGFAIGASARLGQRVELKAGATFDNHGHSGISAGIGVAF